MRRLSMVLLVWFALAASAAEAPRDLELLWEFPTPRGAPQALLPDQAGRGLLYAAIKDEGLAVLEPQDGAVPPRRTATLGKAQFGGLDAMNLAQSGNRLYIALGTFFAAGGAQAGLAIVDVSASKSPKVLSVWKSPQKLHGAAAILVEGDHAYLGAMEHGVFVFDVRDPTAPKKVAEFQPDLNFPRANPNRIQRPNARGLAKSGNLLYVAFDAGGLRIVDVADPRRPREVGRFINPGMVRKQAAYNNLVIDGSTAFCAVDYAGVEVLDVRDPKRIRLLGWWNPWKGDAPSSIWFNSPGHTNQIELDAKSKRLYVSAGDSDLVVLDVSSPSAAPKWVARYGAAKDGKGVWGVALGPDCVYLAYIKTLIPLRSEWAGIKCVRR